VNCTSVAIRAGVAWARSGGGSSGVSRSNRACIGAAWHARWPEARHTPTDDLDQAGAAVADRSDAGAADHREHLPPTAGILDNLHRNWTATLKAQSNVLSTWPRQCLARAELSRGQMISACAALNPDRTASSGTCV